METDNNEKRVLIMGLGNLLLGDEGAGVHAIKYLESKSLPGYCDLLDGGTGGFYLLSLVNEYAKMILIDATLDDKPEGSVTLLKPKFSNEFPRALTTHDIGLKDLLDTATALGKLPEIYLITITITQDQDVRMELSNQILRSLPEIHDKVLEAIGLLD